MLLSFIEDFSLVKNEEQSWLSTVCTWYREYRKWFFKTKNHSLNDGLENKFKKTLEDALFGLVDILDEWRLIHERLKPGYPP